MARTPSRGARWLIVAVASLATTTVAAQPASLSLVSTAWAPFTDVAGRPRFALDLVETALGRVGVVATTSLVTPAEFTPAIVGGKFDGSGAAWRDSEREGALLFSQPYLENRLVLVGRRGSTVSARSLSELAGRHVAIVGGYAYGDATNAPGPTFVRTAGEEDSLRRLLDGHVDYTLIDALVVEYIVGHYPKESATKLAIGSAALVTRPLHLAVRRSRPDAESIISRFNSELRAMLTDGTYHRLLHLDWIAADVTGDGVPELVPRNDRPGPSEPDHAYPLFISSSATGASSAKSGFYLGGNLYTDWASVPDQFKESIGQNPDPRRSTGTIFTFVF